LKEEVKIYLLAPTSTDYRNADKKVGELRGDIGAIRKVMTPSFRKP
jgi:hypothetical protein